VKLKSVQAFSAFHSIFHGYLLAKISFLFVLVEAVCFFFCLVPLAQTFNNQVVYCCILQQLASFNSVTHINCSTIDSHCKVTWSNFCSNVREITRKYTENILKLGFQILDLKKDFSDRCPRFHPGWGLLSNWNNLLKEPGAKWPSK